MATTKNNFAPKKKRAKRPGIHRKSHSSNIKTSKLYIKKKVGQG